VTDSRALRVELIAWEAAVRALQGRFDDALRHARHSVELSLAAGNEHTLARAYLIVDFAEMSLGRSEGLENSNRALEIYTRLGDMQGLATAANNLGGYHYYAGRWDAAADLYRQSRAARERLGDPVSAAYCDTNLAEILVEQGDHRQAETLLVCALTTMRSVGDQWGTAFATRLLGVVKLRTAALDDAAELLGSATTIFTSIGAKAEAFDTRVSSVERLLYHGRADDALALVDTLVAEQETTGEHEPQLPAMLRWRGYAMAQLGDLDAGAAEVHRALLAARRQGAIHEVGLALEALHHLNAATGRETAEADTRERHDIIDRLRLQPRPAPPGWPAARSAEFEGGVGVEQDEVLRLAAAGARDLGARNR
jgi:tetratricopeptide (TPR) repeat protein